MRISFYSLKVWEMLKLEVSGKQVLKIKSPKPFVELSFLYREADLNCRPSGYESDALTS
jgi:hypothetical protein